MEMDLSLVAHLAAIWEVRNFTLRRARAHSQILSRLLLALTISSTLCLVSWILRVPGRRVRSTSLVCMRFSVFIKTFFNLLVLISYSLSRPDHFGWKHDACHEASGYHPQKSQTLSLCCICCSDRCLDKQIWWMLRISRWRFEVCALILFVVPRRRLPTKRLWFLPTGPAQVAFRAHVQHSPVLWIRGFAKSRNGDGGVNKSSHRPQYLIPVDWYRQRR